MTDAVDADAVDAFRRADPGEYAALAEAELWKAEQASIPENRYAHATKGVAYAVLELARAVWTGSHNR